MVNFRGIARVAKTFRLELGPLRAQGAPAVLLGVCGVITATGFARLLAEKPSALSETIREATRFLAVVRGDTLALKPGDDR